MNVNNNKLKFYSVNEKYLDFLRQFEHRIPNIKYENREKFVSGILFDVNGVNYYAPISSFNKQQSTNYVIKFGEYPVGSIRFSFMFPVPTSEIKLKNFENENPSYQKLVQNEIKVCNKNRVAIKAQAKDIYMTRVHNRNTFMSSICCDFKMLEEKCIEWEKSKFKNLSEEKKEIGDNKVGFNGNLNDRIARSKAILTEYKGDNKSTKER